MKVVKFCFLGFTDMMEECEQLTCVQIPKNLKKLRDKENIHKLNVEIEDMKNAIINILGEYYD